VRPPEVRDLVWIVCAAWASSGAIQFSSDLSPSALENFLNFCQREIFKITTENFADMQLLADIWGVNEIESELANFLAKPSSEKLTNQILELPLKRNADTTVLCMQINQHFADFVSSGCWNSLSKFFTALSRLIFKRNISTFFSSS
jgi:hypothetical protein